LRRAPVLPVALVAALTLVLGACGSSGTKKASSAAAPTAAGARLVTIKGYAYKPGKLTLKTGTTLEVTNKDSEPHTLTADDKSFDTGNLDKGSSKAVTLGTAGTFHYYCTLHPYMKGTITVQ
jgi:plastocyanin